MKQVRIFPEQMAEIYWARMKRGAMREVCALINYFSNKSEPEGNATVRYWHDVKQILLQKGVSA